MAYDPTTMSRRKKRRQPEERRVVRRRPLPYKHGVILVLYEIPLTASDNVNFAESVLAQGGPLATSRYRR